MAANSGDFEEMDSYLSYLRTADIRQIRQQRKQASAKGKMQSSSQIPNPAIEKISSHSSPTANPNAGQLLGRRRLVGEGTSANSASSQNPTANDLLRNRRVRREGTRANLASSQNPNPTAGVLLGSRRLAMEGTRRGPSDIVKEKLKLKYPASEISDEQMKIIPECCICYEQYSPMDIVRNDLPCHHLFHQECIDRWVKKVSDHW